MSRTKRNREMTSSRRALREWHYLRAEREHCFSYIRTGIERVHTVYRIVGWSEDALPIHEECEYFVQNHQYVLDDVFYWEKEGFKTYEDYVASHIRDVERDGAWIRGRIEKYWSVQANRRARHDLQSEGSTRVALSSRRTGALLLLYPYWHRACAYGVPHRWLVRGCFADP